MNDRLTRGDFLRLAGLGGAAGLLAAAGGFAPTAPEQLQPSLTSRFWGPLRRWRGVPLPAFPISWKAAVAEVAAIFRAYAPQEIAFLVGLYPDHLHRLARLTAHSLGGVNVLRYSPNSGFEARVTLLDACQKLYGYAGVPVFDLSTAEVIFSFGASFCESWLAPISPELAVENEAAWARIDPAAHVVQFETRRSPAAELADEWIPIRPGAEALLARTLARLARRSLGERDLHSAAAQTGVPAGELRRLARLFFGAHRRLALPGGAALAVEGGLPAAEWILNLNQAGDGSLGSSGFFLAPPAADYPELTSRPASAAEILALVKNIELGRVKALFVHGVDPLRVLPRAYGFAGALQQVERLVSFATFPDLLSSQADLILPDHAPGEAWGYQTALHRAEWGWVEALRPASPPRFNTRATADVLLQAWRASGGRSGALDFEDEQDFLSRSAAAFEAGGRAYHRAEGGDLTPPWAAPGGWGYAEPRRFPPVTLTLPTQAVSASAAEVASLPDGVFRLLLYPAAGERERPSGDPLAEIHPQRAARLGFAPGDPGWVRTAAGALRVSVSLNPHLHPDGLALPVDWAAYESDPGAETGLLRPLDLIGLAQNESGDLITAGALARLEHLA
ncbi:MAG: hypothetical protein IT297_07030 [Anaerolineae bacterium]|nr:hypothetical protein [Anaerolineae bacterium]